MTAAIDFIVWILFGACALVVMCPSMLALVLLVIRRLRHGKKKHSWKYWVGLSLHGASLLLFGSIVGWQMDLWSECKGGGCGSGIIMLLFAPLWWLPTIGGFVLTSQD